jgi:hypothetical protein
MMSPELLSQCRDFLERHGYRLPHSEKITTHQLLDALVQILARVSDEHVLAEAARYLSLMGPAAEPAIQELVLLIARNPITPAVEEVELQLNRGGPWVCGQAALAAMEAIKSISPESGIKALAHLCLHPDPHVRFRAVRALQTIGKPAPCIIPFLLNMLRDPVEAIRRSAVLALWSYSELPQESLETILPLVQDPDPITRIRADYLRASRFSGYQRKLPDSSGHLARLLLDAVDVQHIDVIAEIIKTIPMIGADAQNLAKAVISYIDCKPSVPTAAIAAIVVVLREIISHYSWLKKDVMWALQKIARLGNQTAWFVTNNLRFELSRLKLIRD